MTPGYGPEGQCWFWMGGVNDGGYGIVRVGSVTFGTRRNALAHRLSYALANPGIVLGGRDLVCHRCDTPRCVNPKDLWVGTHAHNTMDSVIKGRHARAATRFTDAQVLAVRESVDLSTVEAAQEFGISRQHVRQLRMGLYRKEVGGLRPMSDYKDSRKR